MRTLQYKCPDCSRKLRPITGMTTATQVVSRKCSCKAQWQLIVTPRPIKGGWLDTATITRKTTA